MTTPRLWCELTKVLRIEILEIFFEVIGHERIASKIGAQGLFRRGGRKQRFGCKDRRLETQGNGDTIGRPRINLDDVIIATQVELRVIRTILDPRQDHATQLRPQTDYHLLHEIVRKWALELYVGHFYSDCIRFRLADVDRDHTIPIFLL